MKAMIKIKKKSSYCPRLCEGSMIQLGNATWYRVIQLRSKGVVNNYSPFYLLTSNSWLPIGQ